MVPLGQYQISRLILGGNPMGGGSHTSRLLDAAMRRYFTPEHSLQLMRDCAREGINLWQTCPTRRFPGTMALYRAHRAEGGQMHYMCIASDIPPEMSNPGPGDVGTIAALAEGGAIAIAHWGTFTDRQWRAGNMAPVQEYLKKVRDAGLLVGLSTHYPEVIDYAESKGWDVDFYMTCVYNPERTREEVQALLGGHVTAPGDGHEVYLEADPPRMYKVVQQTLKTCLVFKILAAGRRCGRQEQVEQAFKEAFSQIKARDAVIVGMYPEYEDQARLNAEYVRRYSDLSRPD
jgi:hypothetical protein